MSEAGGAWGRQQGGSGFLLRVAVCILVPGSAKETRGSDVGSQRLWQQHPGSARAGPVMPGECGFHSAAASSLGAGGLGKMKDPDAASRCHGHGCCSCDLKDPKTGELPESDFVGSFREELSQRCVW